MRSLDSITHRWGELELKDVEAATDWLLKKPWADKRRVYAAGGSYGGFMVAWMNGHVKPGRYAAYVCHAGCFDWVGMFAEDAYTWFPQELGAAYWDDMAKVHSQSPHAFAGRDANAHAGGARRARLPRARRAGAGLLQHVEGARRRRTAAVVPRREPLGAEAAQQQAVVRRVLRLAGAPRRRGRDKSRTKSTRKRSS